MSASSAISLIVFLALAAFAVSSSVAVMLCSVVIMCTIWYVIGRKNLNPHFQKLAHENVDYSDTALIRKLALPTQQANAMLACLRKQMPRITHTIALRPENTLLDDLNLDPVAFELDHMNDLCNQLGLDYEIDHQNPLCEQIKTIEDLASYISTLGPKHLN
jgi:hypothetical protein